MQDPKAFQSFSDFYPFYLKEHSNLTCRRLHFLGSNLVLVCLAMLIATGKPQYHVEQRQRPTRLHFQCRSLARDDAAV